MRARHLEPEDPSHTQILIEGLPREVVVLHATDAHVVEADGREPDPVRAAAASSGAAFQRLTPGGAPTGQVFAEVMARCRQLPADCVALTGDILHFPSSAGLEMVARGVAGLPYLYTLGNHDWNYPHLPWNEASRRAQYPRFHALAGPDPACQVRQVGGGVRLVALDNSDYQLDPAQVAFLRRQLETGQPCLLLVHVPMWAASLAPAVVEVWKAPILMGAEKGWPEEARARWIPEGVAASTRAALDLVRRSPNLVAVLCGHVHFAHADPLREDCYQYVTRPAFEGHLRTVRLSPDR